MSESTISFSSSSSLEDLAVAATTTATTIASTTNSSNRTTIGHEYEYEGGDGDGGTCSDSIPIIQDSTTDGATGTTLRHRRRQQQQRQQQQHYHQNTNIPQSTNEENDDTSTQNKAGSEQQQQQQQQQASQNPLLLLFCASGICTCYLLFGMVQETLFSKRSSNKSNNSNSNTTTFMLVQSCITNVIVSAILIYIERRLKLSSTNKNKNKNKKDKSNNSKRKATRNNVKKRDTAGLNHGLFFYSAFCFFAAMTSSNEALAHVKYPTAVLAKSSKLIPTMIVGYLLDRKSFLMKEWLSAALITVGIVLFNLSRLNQSSTSTTAATNHHATLDSEKDSVYGLLLLVFSLIMDGFLASCQNKLKNEQIIINVGGDSKKKDASDIRRKGGTPVQKEEEEMVMKKEKEMDDPKRHCHYRRPTALETMLWINAYAIVFLLPVSIWSGQFANGLQLLDISNPFSVTSPSSMSNTSITSTTLSIRQAFLMLNITAAIGQIFIFFTIQLFSPLMCTTITTTRKFLTILLSVWKFGHKFTPVQWLSVFMVFGGLYFGIVSKFIVVGRNNGQHLDKSTSSKKYCANTYNGGGHCVDDGKSENNHVTDTFKTVVKGKVE